MLVSGGDNIKFWSVDGLKCIKQIKPHNGDVSSITWSNDNTCLASASSTGDNIILTSPTLEFKSMVLEGKEAKAKTCLAFDSQSRHLAAGGPEGIIHIWNLKRSKLKTTLWQLKGATSCLQYNNNDSLIAASSETAGLMIFNLNSNNFESLNFANTHQPLTGLKALQFNYITHSQLATVSNDSSTILWDAEVLRPIHKFTNGHTAPAMDLSFSPLNLMFLITVGLDKAIVFYDVQYKKVLSTLHTDNLLTSVDIMHDGKTIAIGASNGVIDIYDMRFFNAPVSTTIAHKSTVHKIKFQRNDKLNEFKDDSIKDYINNARRENHNNSVEKMQNGIVNASNIKNEFIDSQINLNETSLNLNSDPLRSSTLHNINSKLCETRNQSIKNTINNSLNTNLNCNSALQQSSVDVVSGQISKTCDPGNFKNPNESQLLDISKSNECITELNNKDAKTSIKELNEETVVLHRNIIKDLIREEMDTYFDRIHRDVASLHNDMIIKFQSLQDEILTSIKENSINNELCLEIKRLKCENEELKKNF